MLQARILRGMCRGHRNITVVGDDAQSIYSFRGASFRNILDFPKQFPGTTIVALEQNYRSTQPILDTTQHVDLARGRAVHKNAVDAARGRRAAVARHGAATNSSRRGSSSSASSSSTRKACRSREIAVLFRAGYMSADLEIELTESEDPVREVGRAQVPRGGAREGRARVPAHYRESARRGELVPRADALAGHRRGDGARARSSAWRRCAWASRRVRRIPRRRRARARRTVSWSSCSTSCATPRSRRRRRRGATSRAFGSSTTTSCARRYDRVEPRLADLDQLQAIAGGYPNRGAFLSALALEPPQATQDLAGGTDEEDDALVLSTAHSAKGKEWDAVFVIWAVDGWFPMARAIGDDEELEEERRLMYVALTRARNHLAVTYPLNVVLDASRRRLLDRSAVALPRSRRAREDGARRSARQRWRGTSRGASTGGADRLAGAPSRAVRGLTSRRHSERASASRSPSSR